jgi:hypothetical protein
MCHGFCLSTDIQNGGNSVGRLIVHTLALLLLSGALVSSFAAAPVIGIATAQGGFLIDNAPVRGNTTLFEGATVETSAATSLVQLQGGARMHLGSASRGRVYSDRLVLEKGEGQMQNARHYRIEARSLQIMPDSSEATAHVALQGTSGITVAALAGVIRVTTAGGRLLARLEPGRALQFEPQAAGGAAPFAVSGCLAAVGNSFILKDETAQVSFEVRAAPGLELSSLAGKRIEVTANGPKGTRPVAGAAEVIYANQVKLIEGACPMPAASPAPGTKRTAGMSGATKAVIAGVVIGGAAGGIALGLTGEETRTPISH